MQVIIEKNYGDFAKDIYEITTENINLCYQCKKCSSGCPVSSFMDYTPNQLIHAARLGQKDLVLTSKTIWLCASCQTCTTRCPQGIDIIKVIDAFRSIAYHSSVQAGVPEVLAFYKKGLANVQRFGRLYELGLIAGLTLTKKDFRKDLKLGIEMVKKGRIKFVPIFRGSKVTKKIFKRAKKEE